MAPLIGRVRDMRTQLDGVPCPFCGGATYHFTLRAEASTKTVGLLAQCSQRGRLRQAVRDLEPSLKETKETGYFSNRQSVPVSVSRLCLDSLLTQNPVLAL